MNWLFGVVGLAWLASVVPCQQGIAGDLPRETRWQGEVRLAADVTVPADGRLVIAAGTVVTIAASDAGRAGFHPDRIELHVRGQLLIEGNLEAPVLFVPDDAQGRTVGEVAVAWHGIVLHPRADAAARRTVVRGTQFFRAFAAVQEPAGDALVEDCVFLACSEGVQVGIAYRDDRFEGLRGGVAAPEIRRCRFVRCNTGIYSEQRARLHVERCVFANVETGVGAQRPVFVNQQQRPGASIVGCAFVEATRGVFGCAIVRESWFLRCHAAVALSRYHDAWSLAIEPVVCERCLVDEVAQVAVGDTGVVRTTIPGAVRPSGDLGELQQAWPPLPNCLRLAADSDCKGKGLGGRDLGPFGDGGLGEEALDLPWEGPALRGWMAAPVDRPRDGKRVGPVELGAKIAGRWWALADTDSTGVLHLKGAFGVERSSGLLAWSFETAAAGKVGLPWTGDVAGIVCWLDGRTVLDLPARRRFGAEQAPLSLECTAGRHLLVVHVTGWGVAPRFAMGQVATWQPVAPAESQAKELAPKARVQGRGRTRYVDVDLTTAVHWRPRPGVDAVELRDATGATFGITWEWADAGVLRLRPAANAPSGQDLRLVWKGLRDLSGRPLELEATALRLP
jgi:hypothetical protein